MKKIFFVNISLLLIIFLLFEISLRLFTNITPQGVSRGIIDQSANPIFNFPNVNGKKVFGEKVFTNNKGFRINQTNKTENLNKFEEIYFVGGSTTFGNGVLQKNTFSGILKENLDKINVFNSSVIGSNLDNNLLIIKKKIKKKNLKNIFVNFSIDDLSGFEIIEDIANDDDKKEIDNFQKSSLISKLKKNFILDYINKSLRSKTVTFVWLKGLFLKPEERYYKYALSNFNNKEKVLYLDRTLKQYAKQNFILNNKIIFLIIPFSNQINNENCKKTDLSEKIIENKLSKYKFRYIKFKNIFCKDLKKNEIFLKYDYSHLSIYGHTIVANTLKREIY
jgi:hypothetical protein